MHTTLISAETLHEHLFEPGWVVVDCRFRLDDPRAGRSLYNEAHVPGAAYADLNEDLAGPPRPDEGRHPLPDLDRFRQAAGAWGIGPGVQAVCYDDTGGTYAARVWWMLRFLGHEAVAVLDGGWQAWVAHGFPTTNDYTPPPPKHFEGEPQWGRLATLEEVAALVAQGKGARLVDARDERRYRGEWEPIDAAAGHIPGARNRPYAQNLTEAGTFRDAAELAGAWHAALGSSDPAEAICYCGSGVSACHNLLAMEHAGLPGARLFIPSWSGWSADPTRPVAQGEEGPLTPPDPPPAP